MIVERDVQPISDIGRRLRRPSESIEKKRPRDSSPSTCGRSPFVGEIAHRWNAERTVRVVPDRAERVVEEYSRSLQADQRAVERRQQRARIDIRIDLQLMLTRGRVGDHLDDVELLLTEAIHAQRLLERTGGEPVIENADTASERGLAAGKRRPGHADPRTHIRVVANVCLELIPNAGRECQVLSEADVVLQINSPLNHLVGDLRVADASRVVAGLIRQEGVEIVKGVRAEIIRRRIRVIPAAIE